MASAASPVSFVPRSSDVGYSSSASSDARPMSTWPPGGSGAGLQGRSADRGRGGDRRPEACAPPRLSPLSLSSFPAPRRDRNLTAKMSGRCRGRQSYDQPAGAGAPTICGWRTAASCKATTSSATTSRLLGLSGSRSRRIIRPRRWWSRHRASGRPGANDSEEYAPTTRRAREPEQVYSPNSVPHQSPARVVPTPPRSMPAR